MVKDVGRNLCRVESPLRRQIVLTSATQPMFQVLMTRTRVVRTCFLVGLALSSLGALSAGHLVLVILPLAGPFAEPCARVDYSWVRMGVHGVLALLAIAAHPARPGPLTACITLVACAWWMLTGFALTYACV
jgi:hypothetical protein